MILRYDVIVVRKNPDDPLPDLKPMAGVIPILTVLDYRDGLWVRDEPDPGTARGAS
jgi:hypothetical protein